MKHSGFIFRPALLALLALLVAGCAAQTLAYRHADWLILWKVDDYVDLNSDQKAFLRDRLKAHLVWHRTEALPVYEAFLHDIKNKSADGVDRDELEWGWSTFERLRADLFEHLVSDGTLFLASVNESQLGNLEQAFRKDNAKVESRLEEATDKRLAKRAGETIRWLKEWVGTLSAEQKQRIMELSRSLPDLQRARLEFEKERQRQFLQLLRTTKDRAVVADRLREWLLFPERVASPDYQRARQEMRQAIKEMVLAVDRLLTPRQRAHALGKLQDLIGDIHGLSIS